MSRVLRLAAVWSGTVRSRLDLCHADSTPSLSLQGSFVWLSRPTGDVETFFASVFSPCKKVCICLFLGGRRTCSLFKHLSYPPDAALQAPHVLRQSSLEAKYRRYSRPPPSRVTKSPSTLNKTLLIGPVRSKVHRLYWPWAPKSTTCHK